ncbi:MAG: DUF111 family protein [Chroococcidiopsidaceae cyanobacterium CP_BM_ER_R8_30]|nr:DUF111 family protein [Chroococcidiopsidaceae cyanobacterium CP_BM_ER_R8_30]
MTKELVTPTAAAITSLSFANAVARSQTFSDPPAMKLDKVGLGAGSQDLTIPNLVRETAMCCGATWLTPSEC